MSNPPRIHWPKIHKGFRAHFNALPPPPPPRKKKNIDCTSVVTKGASGLCGFKL